MDLMTWPKIKRIKGRNREIIIVRNFSFSFSAIDRKTKQKFSHYIKDYLTYIYKIGHPLQNINFF